MYKATVVYQNGIEEVKYFKADKWITSDEPEYIILGDISKIKINRFIIKYIMIEKVKNENN
jgi:hypothetical protein